MSINPPSLTEVLKAKNNTDNLAVQQFTRWVTDTCHKMLEDIESMDAQMDLIDVGRSMYDPNPEHHNYRNLQATSPEMNVHFKGDDHIYIYNP